MNQQSQGTGSLSSPDPPMKRKRGRPRKDENLVHGESPAAMPGPDNLKKNKQSVDGSDEVESEMVGQAVTGVIEGSFDAGYLLNVRVGDTDTQLRGVVFLKEKIVPVTPANDIAPHIKMCKRKDIPIPAMNLKSQFYGSARPSEQCTTQPVEVKNQTPTVADKTQSSTEFDIPDTLDKKSFSVLVENLARAGPSLGGQVMPKQFLEPAGTDSQPSPAMVQSELNNVVEQDKVLEAVEAAKMMEGSNGAEANKASKTETASEPIADIPGIRTVCKDSEIQTQAVYSEKSPLVNDIPGIETVCKDPEIQTQAVDSEKSALVDDEVKSVNLEPNQTPVFAEPAATAVIPSVETVGNPQIQPQAVDSEKSALVHDDVKSLNLELNQSPAFVEPAPVGVIPAMETACKDSQIQSQDVGPEKNVLVRDVVKSPNIELNQTPIFADISSYLASKSVDNVMEEQAYSAPVPSQMASKSVDNVMEEQAYSAPKPSLMFGGETVPSESKLASEGSIPPTMVEPHISSNVDCDVEDVIPPAQS